MELKDAVVLITGGGSGIGRAASVVFAYNDAQVIICGRRLSQLHETVSLINSKNKKVLALQCDVRNWEEVSNLVKEVVKQYGTVDILVNNAGVANAKPLLNTENDVWDDIINTNLKGVFLCCKAVLPYMVKASKGTIINVSSILGLKGDANFVAYCASKFGVVGLTQALAKEVLSQGISVYALCPGRVSTPMQQQLGGNKIANLSMPPDRVAKEMINLASEKIDMPSGSVLIVDDQSVRLILYDAKNRFWWTIIMKIRSLLHKLKQIINK